MTQQIKQRVGNLIEEFIADEYDLQRNKRQKTHGYYDCYDDKTIYEIKAAKSNSYRFIMYLDNHNRLFLADGMYIFVVYDLIDRDHDLQVITDIDIKQIKFVSSTTVDSILLSHPVENYSSKKKKRIKRIRFNEVL
ncbi:MAG: hypothetical protein ACKVE3_06995 [Dissulfuribacterales bacterium]